MQDGTLQRQEGLLLSVPMQTLVPSIHESLATQVLPNVARGFGSMLCRVSTVILVSYIRKGGRVQASFPSCDGTCAQAWKLGKAEEHGETRTWEHTRRGTAPGSP